MRYGYRLCIGVCLCLTGCATSYQPTGLEGGYSETVVAPDVYRIDFHGNVYTSSERAEDFVMLRAAEFVLQNDYTCFAVLGAGDDAHLSTSAIPAISTSTNSGTAVESTYSYQSVTIVKACAIATSTPGQTSMIYKPESGLLVRAFKSKPEGVPTFDAQFLKNSIRARYHLKDSK